MGNQLKRIIPALSFSAGRLLVCLLLAAALAGCVSLEDPESSQEYNRTIVAVLQPEHALGQSFVSRRSGLSTISLWFSAPAQEAPISGVLVGALFHTPQDTALLRQVSVPFTLTASGSLISLTFEPLADPPNQVYYLRLQVQSGELQALGRAEDSYAFGTAYLDTAPQPFDLAFSTRYTYNLSEALSDLARFFRSIALAIPLALLLLLPGWIFLRLFHPRKQTDVGETLAISIGLSLALIPVMMTWTSLVGLHWTRTAIWFAAGLLCAAALYPRLRRFTATKFSVFKQSASTTAPNSTETRQRAESPPDTGARDTGSQSVKNLLAPRTPHLAHDSSHLAFLFLIFILTLAARMIMVRDLAAPPWVDSVHHAVLTRLILEQGALPSSYAPYIEIDTASYHAGFHAVLAVFVWLTGLQLPSAMLLLGQVLNALIVFPIYLLTIRLTRLPLAGLFAALLAGLFTPMPAYYTSWGRYPQLTSLLILPVAFTAIQDLALAFQAAGRQPGDRWKIMRLTLLSGLACAGLFLTHYRVAAFLICLLAADFVVQSVSGRKSQNAMHPLPLFYAILVSGVFALFLLLPWLPATFSSLFIPKLAVWRGGNPDFFSGISTSYLTTSWGLPAMFLAGLGLFWGLLRRTAFPFTVALWCGLLFLLANLEPLGLPGGGFVTNLSVVITLFMPVAVAGGYLIGDWITILNRRLPPAGWKGFRIAWGLALLAASLLAARAQLPILRSLTFLARQADLPAIEWVSENIPSGETVLVNPAGWGYGFYQGQDGGYWIAPLAGRPTLPPPVLYGLDNDPARAERINQLSQQVVQLSADPPALHRLLLDSHIHYIYLGARGGVLSPLLLRESGLFELIYSNQGVWVFRLI